MTKPGIYIHSKTGNKYRVYFTAKDSETLENFVVYEALYDNDKSRYWIRSEKEFEKIVDVGGCRVPRFQIDK